MQSTTQRFEQWAKGLGFSERMLEKATSGDYAHPNAHYAWEGFKAASINNGYMDDVKAAESELSSAGFNGSGVVAETRNLIRWSREIQQRYTRFINGAGGHYCQICGKTLDGYVPPNAQDNRREASGS